MPNPPDLLLPKTMPLAGFISLMGSEDDRINPADSFLRPITTYAQQKVTVDGHHVKIWTDEDCDIASCGWKILELLKDDARFEGRTIYAFGDLLQKKNDPTSDTYVFGLNCSYAKRQWIEKPLTGTFLSRDLLLVVNRLSLASLPII